MAVITIESLGPTLSDELRAALAQADIIIGVDAAAEREFTVFGTPSLESTITMKKPSAMQVVQVPLDFNSGELEELARLVREIKGLRAPRRPK